MLSKYHNFVRCKICKEIVHENLISAHKIKFHSKAIVIKPEIISSNKFQTQNNKSIRKKNKIKHDLSNSRIHAGNLVKKNDSALKAITPSRSILKEWTQNKENILEKYVNNLLNSPDDKKQTNDCESLYIIWDDFKFGKDKLIFDTSRIGQSIIPFRYKGVYENLNLIKDEYFKRIYSTKLFHFYIKDKEIVPNISPGIKILESAIEIVKCFELFKFPIKGTLNKINAFDKFENSEIVNLFKKSIHKNSYIKFLASIQNENFKIIPILEYINGSYEESFIFRYQIKGDNILMAWENVNESRATHLFKSDYSNHRKAIIELESFVNSKIKMKRSSLYSEKNVFSDEFSLKYLSCLKHENIESYKINLYKYFV